MASSSTSMDNVAWTLFFVLFGRKWWLVPMSRAHTHTHILSCFFSKNNFACGVWDNVRVNAFLFVSKKKSMDNVAWTQILCFFWNLWLVAVLHPKRGDHFLCYRRKKRCVCVCYESNLRWLGRFLASLVGVKRTRKGCSIRHVLLGWSRRFFLFFWFCLPCSRIGKRLIMSSPVSIFFTKCKLRYLV